jgi:hypothetical protein
VVSNGDEAISSSMASMSAATDASFSFKRSEGACGMANSLHPEGVRGRFACSQIPDAATQPSKEYRRQPRASRIVVESGAHERHRLNDSQAVCQTPAQEDAIP